jgi:hypothetical protein
MVTKFEKVATNEEEKSRTYDVTIDNKNTYKVKFVMTDKSVDNILKFMLNTVKN